MTNSCNWLIVFLSNSPGGPFLSSGCLKILMFGDVSSNGHCRAFYGLFLLSVGVEKFSTLLAQSQQYVRMKAGSRGQEVRPQTSASCPGATQHLLIAHPQHLCIPHQRLLNLP